MLSQTDVVRKTLEKLYIGRCNVFVYENKQDEQSKKIKQELNLLYEDIPCRLSYSSSPKTNVDNVGTKSQDIKVFLSCDFVIPTGSMLEICQNGVKAKYKSSGSPKLYSSHQEIELELSERWT